MKRKFHYKFINEILYLTNNNIESYFLRNGNKEGTIEKQQRKRYRDQRERQRKIDREPEKEKELKNE